MHKLINETRMKKTQIKALKQLAEMLPASKELVRHGVNVQGKDIDFNDKLKADIPIEEDGWYKKKEYKLVDIDHTNRLKNAFARNKEQGLMDYIEWVDKNNKKLNELFKNLELKRVQNSILDIVKQGSKSFWSNLIQFLFAFYYSYIKTNKNETIK